LSTQQVFLPARDIVTRCPGREVHCFTRRQVREREGGPSASVVVEIAVARTRTTAPATGPAVSLTMPDTVSEDCA
jgi:hypothetical protein